MRLEHHLVGGYVRNISPHIIIIIINCDMEGVQIHCEHWGEARMKQVGF